MKNREHKKSQNSTSVMELGTAKWSETLGKWGSGILTFA